MYNHNFKVKRVKTTVGGVACTPTEIKSLIQRDGKAAQHIGAKSIRQGYCQLLSLDYKFVENAWGRGIRPGKRSVPDTSEAAAILKKTYRKLVLQNHPDKVINLPEEERKEREELFKNISVAYESLNKERIMCEEKFRGVVRPTYSAVAAPSTSDSSPQYSTPQYNKTASAAYSSGASELAGARSSFDASATSYQSRGWSNSNSNWNNDRDWWQAHDTWDGSRAGSWENQRSASATRGRGSAETRAHTTNNDSWGSKYPVTNHHTSANNASASTTSPVAVQSANVRSGKQGASEVEDFGFHSGSYFGKVNMWEQVHAARRSLNANKYPDSKPPAATEAEVHTPSKSPSKPNSRMEKMQSKMISDAVKRERKRALQREAEERDRREREAAEKQNREQEEQRYRRDSKRADERYDREARHDRSRNAERYDREERRGRSHHNGSRYEHEERYRNGERYERRHSTSHRHSTEHPRSPNTRNRNQEDQYQHSRSPNKSKRTSYKDRPRRTPQRLSSSSSSDAEIHWGRRRYNSKRSPRR